MLMCVLFLISFKDPYTFWFKIKRPILFTFIFSIISGLIRPYRQIMNNKLLQSHELHSLSFLHRRPLVKQTVLSGCTYQNSEEFRIFNSDCLTQITSFRITKNHYYYYYYYYYYLFVKKTIQNRSLESMKKKRNNAQVGNLEYNQYTWIYYTNNAH